MIAGEDAHDNAGDEFAQADFVVLAKTSRDRFCRLRRPCCAPRFDLRLNRYWTLDVRGTHTRSIDDGFHLTIDITHALGGPCTEILSPRYDEEMATSELKAQRPSRYMRQANRTR